MKKIYSLSLLLCLSFAALAQPVTTTIYSTGAIGTFTTGNSTAAVRTDNTIMTTAATQRGYAVFDLSGPSGVPAGAVVNSVTIGFYTSTYGGAGAPSGWDTYGFAGDLSSVALPATLFADMVSGTSLTTATYGAATGNQTLASLPATTAFIQNNEGAKVSICFTGGGTRIYTIAGGEPGIMSTVAVNHSPYMTVTYCPAPTGVSASAAPNPLCEGDVLTLSGSATSGASGGYVWSGPGGYTGLGAPATLTVTPASAGVYTLTAVNSCVTYSATATATTAIVTVNPLPAAITGPTAVCTGSAVGLLSSPIGGNWTSDNPLAASVGLSTGLVTGNSSGTANITYTIPSTGCFVSAPMTDNDPPTAITGPTDVCAGSSILLTDGVGGGTWSDDGSGVTSTDPVTGIVTGIMSGSATVSYVTGGCTSVSYVVSVDPLPDPISGVAEICEGSSTTLTETTPGGSWGSSSIMVAVVTGGVVSGISGGPVDIIYTLPGTSCSTDFPMLIDALPAAIGGPTDVCEAGGTITLTDASPFGTFSGGAPNASVTLGGVVTGMTAGAADITYTLPTTCYITTPIAVDPVPSAIMGTTVFCQSTTTTLSDPDAGGTWTSGSIPTATVGASSGIVTGVTGGTTDISYTFPTGCATFAPVTVNAAPTSVITATGPTTFCAGNNVLLTASAGAGNTYQWNVGGVPIPGETNMTYTASTSGSFTVDVTNTSGCVTTSAPTVVTAGFTAVIDYTTPLNFCIGNNVVLIANTGGAVGILTYQWLLNGAVIPSGLAINYTAATSGVYSCAVNISGGVSGTCVDTSAPVTVAVNPLPTPAISYTGTTFVSTGTYAGYQWYVNGVGIPGATSPTYVPVANGSYRLRVTDGIGCAGFSSAFNITGVGVSQINTAGIDIYPNPASSILYITAPVKVRAVISSMEGIKEIDEADAQEININKLASGLYLVTLYDENGVRLMLYKLVKE